MKLASEKRYLIFVRPAGSLMWTQHCKPNGVPYTSFCPIKAFDDACDLSQATQYCAHVAEVKLRPEPDTCCNVTDWRRELLYDLASNEL